MSQSPSESFSRLESSPSPIDDDGLEVSRELTSPTTYEKAPTKDLAGAKLVSVVTSGLSYYVPARSKAQRLLPCFFAQKLPECGPTGSPIVNNEVELLDRVDFVAKPGQFVAIIGPSGSGKTTFLNVVSGRICEGRTEGQVLFNGQHVAAKKIHSILAMVMANDRALAYLTVEETLLYDAHLKLPFTDEAGRRARVESVLEEVGLAHIRHNRVGGIFAKGLSTGEIRRLSIAIELLSNPPVLFLDEPTSTLDAALAFEIICVLKRLTFSGRTIICTIHQPRSSVFALFDKLVVMAKGRVVYQGDALAGQSYFEAKGFRFPQNCNPADVFLEICSTTSCDDEAITKPSKSSQRGKDYDSQEYELSNEQIVVLGESFRTSAEGDSVLSEIKAEIDRPDPEEVGNDTTKYSPKRWCSEVFGITRRSFWNSFRNPLAFGVVVVVQALMGVCLGALFFQEPKNYMPPTDPPYIDSPDSALNQFLSGPFFAAFENGVDGNGSHPLTDALVDGVDGKGSRPFDDLVNNETLLTRFHGMLHCAYDSFQLAREYPVADFSYLQPLWSPLDPTTSSTLPPSETTAAWQKDFGPANPPHIVGDIVKSFQLIDFAVGKFDWYGTYSTCTTDPVNGLGKLGGVTNGMAFYVCLMCYPDTHALLTHLVDCLGWVTLPRLEGPLGFVCNSNTIFSNSRKLSAQDEGAASAPLLPSKADQGMALMKTVAHLAMMTESDVTQLERLSDSLKNESLPMTNDAASSVKFVEKSTAAVQQVPPVKAAAAAPHRALLGHHPDVSSALPTTAWNLMDYGSDIMERLGSCEHDWCKDFAASSNNASSPLNLALNEMSEYGMVLSTVMNVAGILFFATCSVGFASYDALVQFPQERVTFNREMANGMYKVSSYFVGKNIADLTFQLCPTCALVTIYYLMVGIGYEEPHKCFWGYLGVCIVLCWCSYGFAYAISAITPRLEIGVIAAPLILVVFISMAGFFVRDDAIPSYLTWLKYLSLYRWGFFALMTNQFPEDGIYGGLPNKFTLAVAGISELRCWVSCCWLICLAVGFRILGYGFLKYTNRQVGLES